MVIPNSEGVKSTSLPSPQNFAAERPIFCSVADLSKSVGISRATLYGHAKQGRFRAGVHFINVGRSRLWNFALCIDRLVNWEDDALHQQAIERFFESLPSHWPSRQGRDSA